MWIKGNDIQPGENGKFPLSSVFRGSTADTLLAIYARLPNISGSIGFGNNLGGEFIVWKDAQVTDWKNAWNHYAFVVDADQDLQAIYHNGLMVAKSQVPIDPFSGNDLTEFHIGGLPPYNGHIDEFRIYSRALSQGQIITLAQQPDVFQPVISNADTNKDGVINMFDFSYMAKIWLNQKLWP